VLEHDVEALQRPPLAAQRGQRACAEERAAIVSIEDEDSDDTSFEQDRMLLPQDDERIQAVRGRPPADVHEVQRLSPRRREQGRETLGQQRGDVEEADAHAQARRRGGDAPVDLLRVARPQVVWSQLQQVGGHAGQERARRPHERAAQHGAPQEEAVELPSRPLSQSSPAPFRARVRLDESEGLRAIHRQREGRIGHVHDRQLDPVRALGVEDAGLLVRLRRDQVVTPSCPAASARRRGAAGVSGRRSARERDPRAHSPPSY
jgi:hypothetical protein